MLDFMKLKDCYLYGEDLLVAPVWHAGAQDHTVYLPAGATWEHLCPAARFDGACEVSAAAPFGSPPVFHRVGAEFEGLFREVRGL
jgi:alpha-glucosidase